MWDKLPRERREKIFGLGSTVAQVAQMDDQDRIKAIKEYSHKVTNIANKRLKRLGSEGFNTPAYRHWEETTGGEMYGIRGKDLDGVIETIQQAERFNNMGTSTLGGGRQYLREIGERLGLDVSDEHAIQRSSSQIFGVTHKLDEYLKSGGGGTAIGSDELQQYVSRFIQENDAQDMSADDILHALSQQDIYGNIQQGIVGRIREGLDDSLSDFGDFLI